MALCLEGGKLGLGGRGEDNLLDGVSRKTTASRKVDQEARTLTRARVRGVFGMAFAYAAGSRVCQRVTVRPSLHSNWRDCCMYVHTVYGRWCE